MKPRICFIIDHFYDELAGTERQLGRMIRSLGEQFDIDLICLRESKWLRGNGAVLPCNVQVFQINRVRSPAFYLNTLRLIRFLRQRRPSVVHTFFPVGNIIGVIAARLAGVRYIISSRRDYGEWMSPSYLAATRFANRFVSRIVTNSDQVKRLTIEREGFPAERIVVVYNGIDPDSLKRAAPNIELKRSLGVPLNNKVVGLIANYRPMKKQETLVRAAAEIVRHRDDIDFLLVGRDAGPERLRQSTEDLVAQLGLQARVHFAHADGNVPDFLSLLDVGVNCSEGEGLSNAIMEYMVYGIPCVVSTGGGNPDLIQDKVTGRTFEVGDFKTLAEGIEDVLDHAEVCKLYTENAAAKIRNEMTIGVMVERFNTIYRNPS